MAYGCRSFICYSMSRKLITLRLTDKILSGAPMILSD